MEKEKEKKEKKESFVEWTELYGRRPWMKVKKKLHVVLFLSHILSLLDRIFLSIVGIWMVCIVNVI